MNKANKCEAEFNSYNPLTIEDLAVNNKKIQEVEEWLNSVHGNNQNNILLITGPVGSGKTITLKLLAEKHKFKISEWVTPIDIDLVSDMGKYEYREKQSVKFLDFILKSANYASLKDNNSKKLVLVEDFPHIYVKNPAEFQIILETHKQRAKSPLVFICSEFSSEQKNSAINLFTPSMKSQFSIHHIVFNAVSVTNLKAALKRVSNIISSKRSNLYSLPTSDSIDCIVSSSHGDIRSAILNLHFSCLKGVKHNLEVSHTEKETKNKAKKKKHSSSKFVSLGKDLNIGIFHGVGRVLNPKRTEGDTFSNPPHEIVDEFLEQGSSFMNFLHENYIPHFSCIKQVSEAAAALSDADYVMSEWRDKRCQENGLLTAVLGMMLANTNPVSAWNPVRGPKNIQLLNNSTKQTPLFDEAHNIHNDRVLAVDYKTYCKIINTSKENNTNNSNEHSFFIPNSVNHDIEDF